VSSVALLQAEQRPKAAPLPSMRAARVVGPGVVQVEEVPIPEPGPTQVRFKVTACGLSSRLLAQWRGAVAQTYPRPTGESDAEAWGVVDVVGKQVHGIKPGDTVAAISLRAHAEYDVADASTVLRLPGALSDSPFPSRALAGAFNVFERSRIEAGQVVAVVGVGFLGALMIRLANDAGAEVVALSRRPFSLSVAREMGARSVIELDESADVWKQAQVTLNGRLCDVVVETAGRQTTLDWAGRLTKAHGRLLIAGRHDGPREVDLQLWNQRGLEVHNAHDDDPAGILEGMRNASDALSSGRITLAPLLTHRFGLDQLEAALELSERRPLGFVKALIAP
jgi:threonine dehydrogenase-like Zn-dependent dehydrogenase